MKFCIYFCTHLDPKSINVFGVNVFTKKCCIKIRHLSDQNIFALSLFYREVNKGEGTRILVTLCAHFLILYIYIYTYIYIHIFIHIILYMRVIKSRRMRWAGHVARMGEERGVYRVLVGKPEGKRPLGRPRRRWVDNIRMDLQEVGCGYMDWIGLALDRDRWRTLVSAVMNIRVP